MRQKRSLFLLLALLLLSISLPIALSNSMREVAVSITAPFWRTLSTVKMRLLGPLTQSDDSNNKIEIQQLILENNRLKNDLSKADQLAQEATSLAKSLQRQSTLSIMEEKSSRIATENRNQFLRYKLDALPVTVIYRSPSIWSSTLWIDQGSSANEQLDHKVIDKNSPVVIGNALIGIIDYVGKRQSRVRLITDSELLISVRASRGTTHNQYLSNCIDPLLLKLKTERESSFATPQEQKKFILRLQHLKKAFLKNQETLLLAKGELHGSSTPLWRSRNQLLKGTGFNYDFADAEGPSRDLRNGTPHQSKGTAIKILQIGDLLVTSGLDGIFPAELPVATVVEVGKLEEGDYFYELEAQPIAGDLSELSLLFVLPPLGYDPSDRP